MSVSRNYQQTSTDLSVDQPHCAIRFEDKLLLLTVQVKIHQTVCIFIDYLPCAAHFANQREVTRESASSLEVLN